MSGPPLEDGEEILFDHTPSLRKFKRTALVLLGLTLPFVVGMLILFPDTFWPVVPLFVTCVLLMQERVRLGSYRAWVTNRRVILQGGRAFSLAEVTGAEAKGNGVRVGFKGHVGKGVKLFYAPDTAALATAINDAKRAAT